MTLPTATYRLQFRNGMTFDRAIDLISHWQLLGISHLYASPIFAATSGSTHGYDVIDPNLVEPAIGGREGFDRLSTALTQAGIGLILDIVPNHLAASLENPWWRRVIESGQESPFASYFDVDWSRRLTLPVISGSVESELAAGNFKLVIDADRAALAIDYFGSRYPLNPATYREVLSSLDHPMSSDTVVLSDARILDMQPWRFIPWREAPNGLTYRRFFEITGLVGMRVDDPNVFDALHRTVLDMVRRGQVDGLRIDHIDGLADPEAYLNRLREAVGPDTYIVVEKILERDEQLPEQWPVNGTTGYEFIAALADVLVDHQHPVLDQAYRNVSPENGDAQAALRKAKELMVDRNFRGEVAALQRLAGEVAVLEEPALSTAVLDAAIREVLIAFPVYRIYGSPRGLYRADSDLLDEIFDRLGHNAEPESRHALTFVRVLLRGDVKAPSVDTALRFRNRMQHLTGPLLAKALEDTFFYRYNRLLALNEVGGDPLARDGSIGRFHAKMQRRALHQPTALTATSTHDTKRGEDARARLYTISEAPDLWSQAVERWRGMHHRLITDLPLGPAPDPNVEWMLCQALAGVWPPNLDVNDGHHLAELSDRFLAYVEKALREAKLRTDWADNDLDYEKAVAGYASALLSPENREFLDDFKATLQPFIDTGFQNSLTQTLLKMTVPGIPDIYQGCEGLDFSLVDPDNRRLPDFDHLADSPSARQKRNLIAAVLQIRKRKPALFTGGRYVPLQVDGAAQRHVIAFARMHEQEFVIVVAPVLVFDFVHNGSIGTAEPWRGTHAVLPLDLQPTALCDGFTNNPVETVDGRVPIDAIFAGQPFALLMSPATH